MSAVIVTLPRAAPRRAPAPAAGLAHDLPARLHFWRGASGRCYPHTVYGLLECPPLPEATYLLVGRDQDGRRVVLYIGCGESEAPSLNLAQVRRRGAVLGANEVHVHFLADTPEQRRLVLGDLSVAECGPRPRAAAAGRPSSGSGIKPQPVEKRAAPVAAKLAHRRGS
jgi:hypothetical protein